MSTITNQTRKFLNTPGSYTIIDPDGRKYLMESMKTTREANQSEAFRLGAKTMLVGAAAFAAGAVTSFFSDETSTATQTVAQGLMAGGLTLAGTGAKIIHDVKQL